MDYSHQQATHDEVNLLRLVRRLEKLVATEKDWDDAAASQQERVWLQALGTLQKVKHGRKLLRNLEQYDSDPSPRKSQQRKDIKSKLDRIELFMTEVQKRTEPAPPRPKPILPSIPIPAFSIPEPEPKSTGQAPSTNDTHEELFKQREQVKRSPPQALSTTDPLLSPPPTTTTTSPSSSSLLSPMSSLLPATPTPTSFPHSSTTTLSTSTAIETSSTNTNTLNPRKHLQASSALQEELSAQLAQMATQLKRNALHFSDSLAKDKAVIEETQEKLQGNLGTMLKERLRLRDFRSKGRSTTYLVVGVVLAVLLLFIFTVAAIRVSRR